MSKLRSIKIVSIGLLLAMLAVSCNPNTSLPAGNDKKSKTSPGPSTEEPARKIEELAQEPADNHQDHAAKLANLSEQGEEPATSSQEVPEQTQKSSPDEPGKAYQKLEGQAQEGTGLKARSNDAAQKAPAVTPSVPEPASLNLRTEAQVEDPNNDTAAPDALRSELKKQTQKSSPDEPVTKVEAVTVAPRSQEPARPDLRTEEHAEQRNNQIDDEEVPRSNAHLGATEQRLAEITPRVRELAGSKLLTDQSKRKLQGLTKELDDLELKLETELKGQVTKVGEYNTASQKVDKLKNKVKQLKYIISSRLKNSQRERGWK